LAKLLKFAGQNAAFWANPWIVGIHVNVIRGKVIDLAQGESTLRTSRVPLLPILALAIATYIEPPAVGREGVVSKPLWPPN
jgi:hypothetical protein